MTDLRSAPGTLPVTVFSVLAMVLLTVSGCGDGASSVDGSTGSATSAAPSPSSTATATATSTASPSSTPSSSATVSPGATTGSAADIPYGVGSVMSVVGVGHDSALNLRAGPGTTFAVLSTVAPLGGGLVATGRGWQVPGARLWAEVTVGGTTGWASLEFLAVRDGTDDATARVVELLKGRPTAPDMEQLGMKVARSLASTEPASSITMAKAPTLGDLGEVTYDVVGLGDDSVSAMRLVVFGAPIDGGGFSLKSVEATSYCARGTPAGGELCP
jgi:uncharacterized protein YraI